MTTIKKDDKNAISFKSKKLLISLTPIKCLRNLNSTFTTSPFFYIDFVFKG